MTCSDTVLAVDLGLRTGLAWFSGDGRLLRYASKHFANRQTMKRAVFAILREAPCPGRIIVEGGGDLLVVWEKEARRAGIPITAIVAEDWRDDLLLTREQRSGRQAKQNADRLAREIIDASGAKRPTSLRHDAAEAICLGHWALTC